MAHGTRDDLHLMAALIMRDDGPMTSVLTSEQAEEMERKGYRVARIPVAESPDPGVDLPPEPA